MAALTISGEMAFEIHLPQFVGLGAFEARERGVLLRLRVIDQRVPVQDAGNRSAGMAAAAEPWSVSSASQAPNWA